MESAPAHFHSGADSLLRGSHSTLGMPADKGGVMLPLPCKLTSINCILTSQSRHGLHHPAPSSSSHCLLKKHLFEKRHWVNIESEQTVATLPFIKGRNQRSNKVHMAELTLARGNKIHPAGQILQHVLIHLQSEHIFYLFNFFLLVVDYCQSFRE